MIRKATIAIAAGGIILVAVTVVSFYFETTPPSGMGTLKGTVEIGPIFPVCRENVTSTTPPSPWASNQVVVLPQSGSPLYIPISWVLSDGCGMSGIFQVTLASGTYKVDLSSCMSASARAFGCATLPKTAVILPNRTTSIEISVDTGIR